MSPVPSPSTIQPAPLLSSLASDPNPLASLELKLSHNFDVEMGLIVDPVTQLGTSVCVLMDKVEKSVSVSEVSVEEEAAHPADAPRQRSLAYSPTHRSSHTGDRREVSGVCPRAVIPSVGPATTSQVMTKDRCWKGIQSEVSRLSLSSEASSPGKRHQCQFGDESQPLKRDAADTVCSPPVP